MEFNEAVEALKTLVLTHGLPKTDMTLFGTLCPYCGKSDRIRALDKPDDLDRQMDANKLTVYLSLWDQLTRAGGSLGVCKFCQNLLLLKHTAGAVPLYE